MITNAIEFDQYKVGQMFLIINPIFNALANVPLKPQYQKKTKKNPLTPNPSLADDVMVLSCVGTTHKYPISDKKGRCRSLGHVNGSLQFVYAADEGCKGDEMIKEYDFISKLGASIHFIEGDDDLAQWNIRPIDENHPMYDKEMSKGGEFMGNFLGMLADAENNAKETGEDEFKAMGEHLMDMFKGKI